MARFTGGGVAGLALILEVIGINEEVDAILFAVVPVRLSLIPETILIIGYNADGKEIGRIILNENRASPETGTGLQLYGNVEVVADLRIGDSDVVDGESNGVVGFSSENSHRYKSEYHEQSDRYTEQSFGHCFFPPDIFGFNG
jgi:hypothetical protein